MQDHKKTYISKQNLSLMSDYYSKSNQAARKQMHYSPNLLTTLNNAIDNKHLSSLEYDSREKGVTVRDIEPLAVVYKDGKRSLVAYCHLRNEYRSFRLDRINAIKLKHEQFNSRPDFKVEEFQDDNYNAQEDDFDQED